LSKHGFFKIYTLFAISVFLLSFSCFATLQAADAQKQKGEKTVATQKGEQAATDILSQLPLTFTPKVGNWVKYNLEERSSHSTREFTLGVDMAEDLNSHVGYWLEISTTSAQDIPVVLRVLYDPKPVDKRHVKRFIAKTGQHPAVEMDTEGQNFMLFDSQPGGKTGQSVTEEVTVEAGDFDSKRMRFVSANGESIELWLSDKVPLLKLVRATTLRQDFELLDYGSGYKARIKDEIPVRLTAEPGHKAKP